MSDAPLQQKVVLANPQGLHVRPSAAFAELAGRFQSRVRVSLDGKTADGRSPLELMMLVALPGSELTVEADGPDAAAALDALVNLLRSPPPEEPQEAPPGSSPLSPNA